MQEQLGKYGRKKYIRRLTNKEERKRIKEDLKDVARNKKEDIDPPFYTKYNGYFD